MKKEDLNILALIPARAGSKRLPGKNIKELCGKPLIAWTIEAALKSKYLDQVIVSTDSNEIAKISKQYGATIPFIRPENIAQDTSSTTEVINHCLDFLKEERFTHVLLLQATSPLRVSNDIDLAVDTLLEKKANAIYSVCEVDHSPLWMNTLPDDLSFDNFLKPESSGVRSQDLPTHYRLNGALYLVSLEQYLQKGSLFGHRSTYAHIMDKNHSIDIDDELDFIVAEAICNKLAIQ